MIYDICLGYGFYFAWGSIILEYCLGLDHNSLGSDDIRLERPILTAFFFAWGLAWGGFAWGCEAGVFLRNNNILLL